MSIYILLKDMPDAKAGTVFEPQGNGSDYFTFLPYKGDTTDYLHKKYVENNPEWFVKEEVEKEISTTNVKDVKRLIDVLCDAILDIRKELIEIKTRLG